MCKHPAFVRLLTLLIPLLCFGVPTCLAAPAPERVTRRVSNFLQFYTAIQSPAVSVIELAADVTVDPFQWRQVVELKRNLTIRSFPPTVRRLLDFDALSRKIHVVPDVWLNLSNIYVNNTILWPRDGPMYFIGQVLDYSPDSFTIFDNTILFAKVCLPLTKDAELQGLAGAYLRHEKCAPGPQRTKLLDRYCDLQRCYRQPWQIIDFCQRINYLKNEVNPDPIGNNFELFNNSTVVCSNMKQYPCIRKSYAEICPVINPPPSPVAAPPPPLKAQQTAESPAAAPVEAPRKKKSKKDTILPYALGAAAAVVLKIFLIGGFLMYKRHKNQWRASSSTSSNDKTQKLVGNWGSSGITRSLPATSTTGTLSRSGDRYNAPPRYGVYSVNISDVADDDIELSSLIGRGSFGTVFRGVWLGREVAIKVLQHSSTQLDMIQREANLHTGLDHPNVAAVLHVVHRNVGDAMQRSRQDVKDQMSLLNGMRLQPCSMMETWIVLELCTMGSLDSLLRDGAFIHEGVLQLHPVLLRLRDVANGMIYIHSKNIIHGDLKAGNVLVTSSSTDPYYSTSKVADFGLSRVMLGTESHLSTRTMGTPSRMPPELLLKGQLAMAGDVYAFGILMYELATGHPPFLNIAIGQLITQVAINHERPDMPLYLPPQYHELAERCWHPERDHRPTFEEVLVKLDEMLGQVEALQAGMREKLFKGGSWKGGPGF